MSELAELVVGADVAVPVLGGGVRPYASLDHAASTPPFARVQRAVDALAPLYANVHRGAGFKSRLSSWAFEQARERVLAFTGADTRTQVAVFTRNTTESLNHAAHLFAPDPSRVIVTTLMEHHSNDLPWRRVGRVIHVGVDACGRIDEQQLHEVLRRNAGSVAVLAVSGASNVTGIVNPVHRWARWAHEAGARIAVDGAQLVPHRPVRLLPADDPEHLDLLAFSGHKLYAPFGAGVLIGPRDLLGAAEPRLVGGGTVRIVDTDAAAFLDAPERDEAGTPPVLGAVALASAICEIERIGWPAIMAHEAALTAPMLGGLASIDGVRILGPVDGASRLGVVSFVIDGVPHALAAEVLAEEWGIGTRSGCFCAHPYVKALLGIGSAEARDLARRMIAGDQRDVPGLVRASIGLATRAEHVDRLLAGVRAISGGRIEGRYALDPATGAYDAETQVHDFAEFFQP